MNRWIRVTDDWHLYFEGENKVPSAMVLMKIPFPMSRNTFAVLLAVDDGKVSRRFWSDNDATVRGATHEVLQMLKALRGQL